MRGTHPMTSDTETPMPNHIPAEELRQVVRLRSAYDKKTVSFAKALQAAYAENDLQAQQSVHYRERLAGEQMTRVTYGQERDTLKARVEELEEGLRKAKLSRDLAYKVGSLGYEFIDEHNADIDALVHAEGEE